MGLSRAMAARTAAAVLIVLGTSAALSASDNTHKSTEPRSGAPAANTTAGKPGKGNNPGSTEARSGENKSNSKTSGKSTPAELSMAGGNAPSGNENSANPDANTTAAETKNTTKTDTGAGNSNEQQATYTADEALAMLKEGNARWVSGNTTSPNSDASRRRETAAGQHPFVTVITCADSRCPVERLFDRGVGEVFVSRVAGNVIGDHAAGTIEYGVEHLHTPLVLVMGHTGCGAVKAAAANAHPGHNIDSLIAEITPAVERARQTQPNATGEEFLNIAVRENVYQQMFDLLKTSPLTATMVQNGQVKLIGAVYDISTGKVEFIGEHPWQQQLIEAMNLPKDNPATPTVASKENVKPSARAATKAEPTSEPLPNSTTADAESDGDEHAGH